MMQVELGVVEDRMDPEEMGRVRVRILGKHTSNLSDIPTASLPWATVMLPNTSPSTSGVGHTPFLVEGSWVVVAWYDDFMQDPIVLGSIASISAMRPNISEGFNDPKGKFPWEYNIGQPDYNRLGRGLNAEDNIMLQQRRGLKLSDIPKATKPNVKSTENVKPDDRTTWDEPDPKSNTYSQYPYNHVYESEAGHIIEVDDSPDGERLMTQHKSGTFEEIHPTGDKVVHIVRDQYEITMGKKQVFIKGACDITVDGTVRQLIKGDYILEVEGDMTTKVHKNRYTKIGARGDKKGGGNDAFEIVGNRTGNIAKGEILTIHKDSSITTIENHKHTINGDWDQAIMGNTQITTTKECNLTTWGNFGTFSGLNSSMKVAGKLEIDAKGLCTYIIGETLAISSGKLMTINTGSENIEIDSGDVIHLNKSK
jgi:hypothetical protein